jgi:hypothetical protein
MVPGSPDSKRKAGLHPVVGISSLVTQTARAPAAIPAGALPRGITAITLPVAASILDSVSTAVLATQTDP